MESYLTFMLDEEYFAVPVVNVLEVLLKQQVTRVPKTPKHILGIINFRGEILPVIDTRQKFNLSTEKTNDNYVVIVFEILNKDESRIIISGTVDSVKDVVEIDPAEIKSVPELGLNFDSRYISGAAQRDNHFILLLNIDRVFTGSDLAKVQQLQTRE